MSALNQTETTQLQQAQAVLEAVLREGFDPNDSPANEYKRRAIANARDGVKTVVTMKGYYPS